MSDWLVRIFVRDADNVSDPIVRARYGQFAGMVCIVCNVLLCVGKAMVGIMVGSVSIVADAINNLSDASSNIISMLGFKPASKPADDDHPFGHGRFEYLAGLTVSVLITAIGINLVMSSISKIANPQHTAFGPTVVVVLVASAVVKLWMMAFNNKIGRRISSDTLIATAIDSRNDVITTSAVLASAVISSLTGFDLDGWAGVAVGAFILWSGFTLIRDSIGPLLGATPDPRTVEHIKGKIMSYPGVLGTHDLMVHDYGPGRQFASAHVEMAGEANVFESHDLIDNIEQDFKREGLVMTLHLDPIVTNDPAIHDMRNWINLHVKDIDPRLSIHDLRTVPGPTHTNVIFDCVRPHDLTMTDDELCDRIQQVVSTEYPQAICKVTIDSSYLASSQ